MRFAHFDDTEDWTYGPGSSGFTAGSGAGQTGGLRKGHGDHDDHDDLEFLDETCSPRLSS